MRACTGYHSSTEGTLGCPSPSTGCDRLHAGALGRNPGHHRRLTQEDRRLRGSDRRHSSRARCRSRRTAANPAGRQPASLHSRRHCSGTFKHAGNKHVLAAPSSSLFVGTSLGNAPDAPVPAAAAGDGAVARISTGGGGGTLAGFVLERAVRAFRAFSVL